MRRLSSLSSTTSIFFSIALPLLRAPAPPGQYAARDADSQPEVASRRHEFDMPDAIRLAPRDAGPDALRAEPHRRAPHRERAHRALQLPLRAPPRRRVRAPHRGHGPRALDRGVDARHPRGPRLARPHLGRGPVPPERAPGPLPCARRQAALAAGRPPAYDRTCRERTAPPADRAAHALRFRTPLEGETVIDDHVKGRVVFRNVDLDDFIIVRSDGMPVYNFCVVVDDHDMRITHVIRGDDLLASTPRQVLLYRAFGAAPPAFAHVPQILGLDKSRLSKRHGATSVLAYREMGYLPDAVVNYLSRLGWSHGDQ